MSNDPQSITIDGRDIPLQTVADYSPFVHFHDHEKYFPCTIEYALRGASLMQVPLGPDGKPDYSAPGTLIKANPTEQDLGTYDANVYRIDLVNALQGEGLNGPMYVAIQFDPNKIFVDFSYEFLFGFNGAQVARSYLAGLLSGFVSLPDFGNHQGDIEGVTVRLNWDLTEVLSVRYAGHGHDLVYLPSNVLYDGTHPLVRCALNSHATYNPYSMSNEEFIELENYKYVGFGMIFGDLTASSDHPWKVVDANGKPLPGKIIAIGLQNGQPINDEVWAKFRGRIGRYQINDFRKVQGIDAPLAPAIAAALEAAVVDVLGFVPEEKKIGLGPEGPGGRDFIDVNKPDSGGGVSTKRGFLRLQNRPNLALEANTSGTGVTVAQLNVGNTRQQWQFELYGDFGYRIRNLFLNLYMIAPNNKAPVVLAPKSQTNQSLLWNQKDAAYRPYRDFDQNLNVFGSNEHPEPGSPVGVWTWESADYNATWSYSDLNTNWPPPGRDVRIVLEKFPNLVLDGRYTAPVLAALNFAWDTQIWTMVDYGYGLIFINKQTGMVLSGPADRQSVTQWQVSLIDDSAVWSLKGVALRPVRNTDMNLNVFGSDWDPQPGPVGIWNWSNPAKPNESWVLAPV